MRRGTLPLSRLLALGLLVAVVLAAAGAWVVPWSDARLEADLLADRLARTQRATSRLPRLETKREAALDAVRRSDEWLLPPGEDALAQAALLARMQQVFADAGGFVRDTRTLDTTVVEGFTQIGVEIVADVTHAALHDALVALEDGAPLLLLDKLEIGSAKGAATGEPLRLTLVAVGFARASE